MTPTIFFLITIIGFILFLLGRYFKDYTGGILGGLLIFFSGLFVLLDPLTGIESFLNTSIGIILFGLGAYIWVVGSIELLKDKGWV